MDQVARDDLARERADSALEATRRINGQIVRLGDEVAGLREDHGAAITGLKVEMGKQQTRTGIYAAIGAGIASAVIAPIVVVALVMALHLNHPQQAQPKAPPAAASRSLR